MRLFFTPLVAGVWVVCSFLSYLNPGRAYGLYAVSSIAGSWIVTFMGRGDIHNVLIPLSIAVAGGCVMAAAGFIMDKLRVPRKPWAIGFGVAVVVALVALNWGYPSAARASARGGSWAAYAFYSINVGLYIATVAAVAVVGIGRFLNRDSR